MLKFFFLKDPYPKKKGFELLSQKYLLPINKIQNFFKYQRKLDFTTQRKAVKIYKVDFFSCVFFFLNFIYDIAET